MYVSVVTPKEGREIIETRSPLGLYMFVVKRKWIAVDNRTGDAWTEEFDNSREAMKWLLGEERGK